MNVPDIGRAAIAAYACIPNAMRVENVTEDLRNAFRRKLRRNKGVDIQLIGPLIETKKLREIVMHDVRMLRQFVASTIRKRYELFSKARSSRSEELLAIFANHSESGTPNSRN